VEPRRGVDADDPQPAEVPLLVLAAYVGEVPRPVDGLLAERYNLLLVRK